MTILTAIYYAGIASCGIQGAEKSTHHMQKNTIIIMLCAFLSGFAGGLIRDIIVLHVYPAALTIECLPDILTALFAALLCIKVKEKKYIKWFSVPADSAGLAQFISIGVNKASIIFDDKFIQFTCGVTTALGGGIISSLFFGESLKEILSKSIPYRLLTVIGTIIYIYCVDTSADIVSAQCLLVLYTSITISLCDTKTRTWLKCYVAKAILQHQYLVNIYSFGIQPINNILPPLRISPLLFSQIYNEYKINYNFYLYFSNKSLVLQLHRIRQM